MTSKTIYRTHEQLTFSPKASRQMELLTEQHSAGDRTPYVYYIAWTTQDRHYFGVRFAKNCHPREFWISYFTSSETVAHFRDKYGDPDKIQIRRIFDDRDISYNYENRVLSKLKLSKNVRWLNVSVGRSYGHFDSSQYILVSHEEMDIQKYVDPILVDSYIEDGFQLGMLQKHRDKMSEWRNVVDESGMKMSERIAHKVATIKRERGTLESGTLRAIETMSVIGDDGLTGYQRAGLKVSETLNSVNELTGMTVAQDRGKVLSVYLNSIDYNTGRTQSDIRMDKRIKTQLENNSPDLVILQIFNTGGELQHEIVGRWKQYCKELGMPLAAIKRSFDNGGRPMYILELERIQKKQVKFKKYFGWYAIRLSPQEYKTMLEEREKGA